MVTDLKVDLELIKSVLYKVINENTDLLSDNENVVLQALYEHYEPKSNIDVSHLEFYKEMFSDFFAEKCRNLAKYRSEDINVSETQQITSMKNSGEIFKSGIFNTLKRHLYLEMHLLGQKHQIAISIISTLYYYLSDRYYFEVKSETLEELFFNALMLYLSNQGYSDTNDVEIISIVKSMKRLLGLRNFDFEIKYGDIYFVNNSESILQCKIVNMIKSVGGIDFLKLLFNREISPKYNKSIDRFMIHRNMKSLVMNIDELRVPYNYLIQLAVMHLNETRSPLLTENGQLSKYDDAIKLSSDYLNVLDLQSYSIWGDMFWNYENIPVKLCKNIIFEKMFTPVQYCPDFVIRFINGVYAPLFDGSISIGYNFNEYLKLCKVILREKRACVSYTFDDLKKATKLKQTTLKNILDDVSIQYNEVNIEYNNFLAKTNYSLKPLVKLKNNTYFLFSTYFNGFAFCEVLYNKLKTYYPGNFNRLKGDYLEDMIKSLFKEKGFCFHSGNYITSNSENLECDMILEDEKHIIFIEIKNQPLLDGFELGDDVETLYYLGEGMIKAQKQCFKHIKHLKSAGKLIINTGNGITYELTENQRRIICISVCSQEYLFLSNKTFSENFMQSLLIATYHATDPSKESRLKNLNQQRNEIEQLISDIYGKERINAKKVFFNTLFRSAQQIFTILSVSKTLNEFIYHLTKPIYFADGSGDVYHQLLASDFYTV